MNVDQIYSGSEDWLKAVDLESRAEWHLRIEEIGQTSFKQKDGTEKKQVVLKFFGAKKRLGLNVTNKNRMVKMFGKETDNWISQEVTLYVTETEMDGETRLGIRIRDKSTTQPTVKSEPPAATGFVSGLPINERNPPQNNRIPAHIKTRVEDDMDDEVPF